MEENKIFMPPPPKELKKAPNSTQAQKAQPINNGTNVTVQNKAGSNLNAVEPNKVVLPNARPQSANAQNTNTQNINTQNVNANIANAETHAKNGDIKNFNVNNGDIKTTDAQNGINTNAQNFNKKNENANVVQTKVKEDKKTNYNLIINVSGFVLSLGLMAFFLFLLFK